MRRPHPRFDSRRNAWVTNAGGKLKLLARGPQDAASEAAAWDAFFRHMAELNRPVATAPAINLGQLADQYGQWMDQEVTAERMKPATREYYRLHLQRFLDAVGGNRPAAGILPDIKHARLEDHDDALQCPRGSASVLILGSTEPGGC